MITCFHVERDNLSKFWSIPTFLRLTIISPVRPHVCLASFICTKSAIFCLKWRGIYKNTLEKYWKMISSEPSQNLPSSRNKIIEWNHFDSFQIHPFSVFRPEGSPEEQKRFRWDIGSAEDLPVRFHLDSLSWWNTWPNRKDSGVIMYGSGGSQPECHRKPEKRAEALLLKKWGFRWIYTSNHMVLRVIWEKSSRGYLTKFWNHPERSEGDFKILLNNQGMIFPKSPENDHVIPC